MANILQISAIIGDKSYSPSIEKIGLVQNRDQNFFKIDDEPFKNLDFFKKWQRSLAKDTLIAAQCVQNIVNHQVAECAHGRLGLYGAFVNGPYLYNQINELLNCHTVENFQNVKKNWPPKQHFRQNAPLKLAHLSFILKNQGPMSCFTDPFCSALDALQVAEMDLISNRVDLAIVVSAFSFEEPSLVNLYSTLGKSDLFECGVAILLEKSTQMVDYRHSKNKFYTYSYGVCSPLIGSKDLVNDKTRDRKSSY